MSRTVIGVGDFVVSARSGDELVILGLGSCVALAMFTPRGDAAGLAHVALPLASANPDRATNQPAYFADTAVPAVLEAIQRLATPPSRRYIVKLVGGAAILDPEQVFSIGKRNVLELKKTLWRHGLGPLAEDTGKTYSRSVVLRVGSTRLAISSPERGSWEI